MRKDTFETSQGDTHLDAPTKETCTKEAATASSATVAPPASADQPTRSAEWSEESGSDDDFLLEDIISKGMPSGRSVLPKTRQQLAPPSKLVKKPVVNLPKSVSAHSLSRSNGCIVPPQATISSSLSNDSFCNGKSPAAKAMSGNESDSDCSVEDDEILYACIQSAMPKAKPAVGRSLTSSAAAVAASSASTVTTGAIANTAICANTSAKYPSIPVQNGVIRKPKHPMELPKGHSKEVIYHLLHFKESNNNCTTLYQLNHNQLIKPMVL